MDISPSKQLRNIVQLCTASSLHHQVWHANKTLSCSIVHPGLPDQLEASTRILLALPPSVRAATFPVSGIIGIAVFALLLTAIVVSLVVFKCRKARGLAEGKTDPEKAESNETGLDKGSKTESATEDEEEDRQDESQCPQQTAPASCLPCSLCEYQPQTETDDLTNIVQLIGVTFVITTIVWAAVFKNGIKFSSTELGIDFNWHPILMTISLLFLYGNGRLPSTRLLCNS